MSPAAPAEITELVTGIYRGQTHRLTQYVRAFGYAADLLAQFGPFETPEQARAFCLKLADRRARRTDKET
jgi:hypothetical protein